MCNEICLVIFQFSLFIDKAIFESNLFWQGGAANETNSTQTTRLKCNFFKNRISFLTS